MPLQDRVHCLNSHLSGLEFKKKAVADQLGIARKTMMGLEQEKAHLLKCIAVLDTVIQKVAEQGVGRVETVVTQGLQLVFGTKVSCLLEKRVMAKGTTYAVKIKVTTPEGDVVDDPMEAFGGGAVNLISFLMRVLMIHRFKLAKLMVLDESFNNVSRDHLGSVSALLKTLTDDHGYSVIAITHQPEITSQADQVYQVSGVVGEYSTIKLLTVGEEA